MIHNVILPHYPAAIGNAVPNGIIALDSGLFGLVLGALLLIAAAALWQVRATVDSQSSDRLVTSDTEIRDAA